MQRGLTAESYGERFHRFIADAERILYQHDVDSTVTERLEMCLTEIECHKFEGSRPIPAPCRLDGADRGGFARCKQPRQIRMSGQNILGSGLDRAGSAMPD